jgi:uncharacterized protein
LAFTTGRATFIAAPAFWYVRKHRVDLMSHPVELPKRFNIDRRLIGGSAIFGVGWGLAATRPGPGLLLLTAGSIYSFVFCGGVILGFLALRLLHRVPIPNQ